MNTEAVVKQHMVALGKGDMEAVMADYSEGAILCSPQGLSRGHAEIRATIEPFVKKVLPPGSDFKLQKMLVDGEVAYIAWTAESAGFRLPLGTDTFVVRDGKIVAQTFTAQIERKA